MMKAKNPLSKALLHSVPKKLYLWIQAIHATHTHAGVHRCEFKDDGGDYSITLTWDFQGYNATEPKRSTITIGGTRFGPVTIHWDGDVFADDGTLIDNELFTDINANLSAFCELEQLTYACMENYAEEQRALQKKLKYDRDDDDLQAPATAEV
jgi:hypothetical protein